MPDVGCAGDGRGVLLTLVDKIIPTKPTLALDVHGQRCRTGTVIARALAAEEADRSVDGDNALQLLAIGRPCIGRAYRRRASAAADGRVAASRRFRDEPLEECFSHVKRASGD